MDEAIPILSKQLASLLGYEDSVEELLEMLLTIESKADLRMYLEQFLGTDKDIQPLIEDIGRVQQGQMPLMVVQETKSPPLTTSVPNAVAAIPIGQAKTANHTATTKVKKALNNNKPKTGKQGPQAWKALPKKSNPTTNAARRALTTTTTTEQSGQTNLPFPERKGLSETLLNSHDEAKAFRSAEVVVMPLRGKPDVVCGCFGNRHSPLANCLHCGRISCVREGLSYCAFCGYLVKAVEGNSNDVAWNLKERLLNYDRESAQRTVVIDDQADYYNSSTWLTETEETEAKEMAQIHYDEKHRRGHATMKLHIG